MSDEVKGNILILATLVEYVRRQVKAVSITIVMMSCVALGKSLG